MAASARSRKRKSSTTKNKQPSILIRAPRALGGLILSLLRWIRRSPVPDQVKREIGAVLAILIAVLISLSLLGYVGSMTVVGTLGEGLTWIAGRGAVLFPIGLDLDRG